MRSWRVIPSITLSLSLISAPISASAADRNSDWANVMALPRGAQILVRAETGIDGRRSFVLADVDALVVLNLGHPALSDSVRKRLRAISVEQPTALLATRQRTIVSDRTISVGAGVISEAGRTLVALDEVLQTIARSNVREIRIERTRGSKVGAIAGATAGIVAGIVTAPYWMMKPCGGSCGDEQFMLGVSLVGLPVAGALVGYLPRGEEVVVYRTTTTN